MLNDLKIRRIVLTVHGVLALLVGLAFFYLGATMTNLMYETIAVAIAIVLSTGALILAAIADWFAAFGEGRKQLHRVVFYGLAGLILAATGVVLGYYPEVTMQWLLVLAAFHAFVFGALALMSAPRAAQQPLRRRYMYIFGSISILFSGMITGFGITDFGNPSATALLGTYLCFMGVKMFLFAWSFDGAAVPKDGRQSLSASAPTTGQQKPLASLRMRPM